MARFRHWGYRFHLNEESQLGAGPEANTSMVLIGKPVGDHHFHVLQWKILLQEGIEEQVDGFSFVPAGNDDGNSGGHTVWGLVTAALLVSFGTHGNDFNFNQAGFGQGANLHR